jgi:Mrp family chromosome partitioning ATPase
MTAVNLAITLAAAQKRVVLIDTDLRRPMLSAVFGSVPRSSSSVGAALETGEVHVGSLIKSARHPGLSLLLAREERDTSANPFSEARVRKMLDALRPHFDVVVLDSPPIPEVADAIEVAAAVDAVLICVRVGNTRRDKLSQLRELLAWRGIAPVGFVLTYGARAARSQSVYGHAQVNHLDELPNIADVRPKLPSAQGQDR